MGRMAAQSNKATTIYASYILILQGVAKAMEPISPVLVTSEASTVASSLSLPNHNPGLACSRVHQSLRPYHTTPSSRSATPLRPMSVMARSARFSFEVRGNVSVALYTYVQEGPTDHDLLLRSSFSIEETG